VIDPVSWAAVILIGTQMEDHLQHGFTGSRPSVVTPDSVVRKTIIDLDVDANTNPWQQQKIVKLREFHKQVEALLAEGKITLRKRTLRMLRDSELKMERIAGA
jgi:hypothetical protein